MTLGAGSAAPNTSGGAKRATARRATARLGTRCRPARPTSALYLVPARASRVPTAAHRCSRGASGRNKEFRVACFSHSTTMRETTVCYLRPKTRPNRQGGGPSCERASTPGRSFRKRWLESARSLQYWPAAGSRRKPPSCLLPSRVQVCRAATGAGVRGSRSSPSGAPLASRGASRRRPSASRHELVVRALLGDPPPLDDADAVGVPDGRQPVRDDDHRHPALRNHRVDRRLHHRLALRVERARRLSGRQGPR